MRQRGFRGWKVFGGLAAVTLLGVGCGRLPRTGGDRPDDPKENFLGTKRRHVPPDYYSRFQYPSDRGYNGTIQTIGSSIDPRTAEKQGTPGRSRVLDVTGRPAPAEPELGIGGSGSVGIPDSTSDMGWRARRGYDADPSQVFGSYGEGQKQ
jgi:hypothetical protein